MRKRLERGSLVAVLGLICWIHGIIALPPRDDPGAALKEESYSCVLCHPGVKSRYVQSIHYKRRIDCARCHGGDPGAFDVEGAKTAASGYRAKISKEEGVRLCASCHSDEEMMRQYGLSTDQYQQYLTSRPGKMLLEEKNTDVATCVDCHGVHLILPSTDPSSKVYRKNLLFTCGACHSDKEYMGRYSIPTNQLEDYLDSVHGRPLIEENNRSVPECARCHGVHGARAPGTTEVFNVCGQCHPFIREQFMKSPHFQAEREGRIEGCVACHGNHRIVRANSNLLEETCVRCHEAGSEAARVGIKMREWIDGAWKKYGEGEEEIRRARLEGIWVGDEEIRMEEARTLLVRLMTTQHTVDLDVIEGDVAKATSMINNVITTLEHNLVSIRVYKLALIPIWFFIAGMVALFTSELRGRWGRGADDLAP